MNGNNLSEFIHEIICVVILSAGIAFLMLLNNTTKNTSQSFAENNAKLSVTDNHKYKSPHDHIYVSAGDIIFEIKDYADNKYNNDSYSLEYKIILGLEKEGNNATIYNIDDSSINNYKTSQFHIEEPVKQALIKNSKNKVFIRTEKLDTSGKHMTVIFNELGENSR